MKYIETIKIIDKQVYLLPYHNQRAGITFPPPNLPAHCEKGLVKWRLVYGEGDFVQSFSPYVLPKIKSLRIVHSNSINYERKYENREELNKLFEQRKGCDDIIIVKEGYISDSLFCNLVFQNKEGLFTPSTPLLKGTKRQYLLDRGVIREREIRLADITHYQSISLINAMIETDDNITVNIKDVIC